MAGNAPEDDALEAEMAAYIRRMRAEGKYHPVMPLETLDRFADDDDDDDDDRPGKRNQRHPRAGAAAKRRREQAPQNRRPVGPAAGSSDEEDGLDSSDNEDAEELEEDSDVDVGDSSEEDAASSDEASDEAGSDGEGDAQRSRSDKTQGKKQRSAGELRPKTAGALADVMAKLINAEDPKAGGSVKVAPVMSRATEALKEIREERLKAKERTVSW